MNIILDKKAFNEWKDRVTNIHQELDEKYCIDVAAVYDYITCVFNDDYDGTFVSISSNKECMQCFDSIMSFNHRNLNGEEYTEEYNRIMNIKNDVLCCWCNNKSIVQLPKNYF